MSLTATPTYPQTPKAWGAQILNATGAWTFSPTVVANLVVLAAGGANGAKVEAINISSNDSAAQTLALVFNDGTNNYVLGEVPIPIGAGITAAIPAANPLNLSQFPGLPYDSSGNEYVYVPVGWTLYVGVIVAVTATKQISVLAFGSAF